MRCPSSPTLAALLLLCISLSSARPSNDPLITSTDGTCGSRSSGKFTCTGSKYGAACSKDGYCGCTTDFYSTGCQPSFGQCGSMVKCVSPDGSCGGTDKMYTCVGSNFGDSCGRNNTCGRDAGYSGDGCQPDYGTCSVPAKSTMTTSSSSSTSSTFSSTSSTVSSTSSTVSSTIKTSSSSSPSSSSASSSSASTNTSSTKTTSSGSSSSSPSPSGSSSSTSSTTPPAASAKTSSGMSAAPKPAFANPSTTTSTCTATISPTPFCSSHLSSTYVPEPCFPNTEVCYPTNYYAAEDQGQLSSSTGNYEAVLQAKCASRCDATGKQCQSFVGVANLAADTKMAYGTCFYYSVRQVYPRQCPDASSKIIAYYKQGLCSQSGATGTATTTTASGMMAGGSTSGSAAGGTTAGSSAGLTMGSASGSKTSSTTSSTGGTASSNSGSSTASSSSGLSSSITTTTASQRTSTSSSTAATSTAANGEAIGNGSFESGSGRTPGGTALPPISRRQLAKRAPITSSSADGWTIDSCQGTCAFVMANPQQGLWSFNSQNSAVIYQDINLQAGAIYSLSYWVNTLAVAPGVFGYLSIYFGTASVPFAESNSKQIKGSSLQQNTAYANIVVPFTVDNTVAPYGVSNGDGTYRFRFYIVLDGDVRQTVAFNTYVDNFSATITTPAPAGYQITNTHNPYLPLGNQVTSGSFENQAPGAGNTNGATNDPAWLVDACSGTCQYETPTAEDGTFAFSYTGASSLLHQPLTLPLGWTYELRFWSAHTVNVATVRANIFNAYAADTSFTFSLTAPGTMPAATPPPGTAVQGQYTLGTKSDPVNGYKTDPVGASRPFWTGQSYFFPLNAALCARYGTVTADGFGCLTQLNGQGLNFQADPAITLYLDLISINARYLHTG